MKSIFHLVDHLLSRSLVADLFVDLLCINMLELSAGMCPSLTAEVLSQLNSKGITKVAGFISMDPERITALCGLQYKKVISIRRVLLAQYSAFPVNGLDLYNEILNTVAVLPTACSNLDEMLDSGIYTGEVTEFVGVSVSGKTQICQTLTANVAAFLGQTAMCIDTTGGWSVKRTADIVTERFPTKSVTQVLSRIKLCQCFNAKDLLEALDDVRNALHCREDKFFSSLKLLVIDSVAAVLSPAFLDGEYIEGLSLLQSAGRKLNALAKDFAIAIVMTNYIVTGAVTGGSSTDSFLLKPALGRCWTFVPSVRVHLKPTEEPCQLLETEAADGEFLLYTPTIIATLDKSPRRKNCSTTLTITQAGISNST